MNLDATIKGLSHIWEALPEAFFSFVVGYIAIRAIMFLLRRILRISRIHKEFTGIIESFANLLLWVLLIGFVVQTLGFQKAAIAISGSIALVGFGVATGANALIADIISGLYLARDHDFKIGSRVKFGDIEGTIEKIDIRKVRILTKNGEKAIIANSNFDKSFWIVYQEKE